MEDLIMGLLTLTRARKQTEMEVPAGTRQTLEEAYNTFCTSCRLQQILDGDRPIDEWVEALQGDLADANRLLVWLTEDIQLMTQRRVGCSQVVISKKVKESFDGPQRRVQALKEEVCNGLFYALDAMVCNIKDQRAGIFTDSVWYFSMSPVKMTPGRAEFTHLGLDNRLYKVIFVDPALKCPDDFTRRIPKHAQHKLDLLKRTHFDYRPKVLDGLLVEEEVLRHKNWLATKVRNTAWAISDGIEEFMMDPAIAVSIGNKEFKLPNVTSNLFAIDFWKEPFPSELKRFGQRILHSWSLRFAWFAVVGLLAFWGMFVNFNVLAMPSSDWNTFLSTVIFIGRAALLGFGLFGLGGLGVQIAYKFKRWIL